MLLLQDGDLFLEDTWFTRTLIIHSSPCSPRNNYPACLVHSVVSDSQAFLCNWWRCMFILFFMYLFYSLCSRHSSQLASCPANWACWSLFFLCCVGWFQVTAFLLAPLCWTLVSKAWCLWVGFLKGIAFLFFFSFFYKIAISIAHSSVVF